jgi:hypothetical protein
MARRAASVSSWVRLGAAMRLAQLDREQAAIFKAYPGLRRGRPADALAIRPVRRISAKGRQAMKAGMRRYWAKRKAAGK